VDDERAFARLMKTSLEVNGDYDVQVESEGAKALATAGAYRPDLILLDVMMPDVDGARIAAAIRADPALRRTPIVFLTAVVSKNTVVDHGGSTGLQTYLAKPVTVEDVIDTIERLLGRS